MFRLLLITATVLATISKAEVITDDISLSVGRIRYHYDKLSSDNACQNLLILGVGTGMKTTDYDLIGHTISKGHDIVTMIVDQNPFWLTKTSAREYADLANTIVEEITVGDMLEDLCQSTTPNHILIGGHSASGQAAWNSVNLLDFTPAGYVGLDPFRLDPNDEDKMDIPTLMWGFSETTCAVSTDLAAKAGYQASEKDHRVFYKISNDNGGPGHCSFTDAGCYGKICPSTSEDVWVHAVVGNTVNRFLQAIKSGTFDKSEFSLKADSVRVPVELYLNEDTAGEVESTGVVETKSHVEAAAEMASTAENESSGETEPTAEATNEATGDVSSGETEPIAEATSEATGDVGSAGEADSSGETDPTGDAHSTSEVEQNEDSSWVFTSWWSSSSSSTGNGLRGSGFWGERV